MFIYNIALYFLALGVKIASLFNQKAKLLNNGVANSWSILKTIDKSKELIWVHSASLGEFEQGRTLIEKIKAENKEAKVLLTFFSPSGYEIRKNYEHADYICYLPIDTKANAKKFIKLVNPSKAFIIKYEFWLNYLTQLKKNKIDTYIVSSIFRENQIFFKWYGGIFNKALKSFKTIFVQNQVSKDILANNGISNVVIAGDTRIDRVYQITSTVKEFPEIKNFCENKTTIIFGSTWDKDEDLICEYVNANQNKNLRFIIAPHEVHAGHVNQICKKLNINYIKYSEIENINEQHQLIIVDCIGILSSIYQYAKIAYIGGGFGVGIHNTLEPATFGLPIMFGPKYQKFDEAHAMIAVNGAYSISEYPEFKEKLDYLLGNYETHGKACADFIKQNKGATELVYNNVFPI
jgi:3-deoxy-D-manno-octulosonic-acid transferase